jgi:cytoskeletal protein CcmA (bactofilin family)
MKIVKLYLILFGMQFSVQTYALTPIQDEEGASATVPTVAPPTVLPPTLAIAGEIVAAGEIVVDGKTVATVDDIEGVLKDGSTIFLGPGVYSKGFHILADQVTVVGDGSHFKNAAIEGKGAIIVSGNGAVIEGIECSDIEVADKNGACVRQQGKDLTLVNVYFHDSEQGVLQAPDTGFLHIRFSRFDRLGRSGYAHGIYAQGSSLVVSDSSFIGTTDQGHSIKSRAPYTKVTNSVLNSADGYDSRLVDISNGGVVILENNVFYQGLNTVNSELLSYGLEDIARQRKNEVKIHNNIFIAERPNGNNFLMARVTLPATPMSIKGNVFVGQYMDKANIPAAGNHFFEDRDTAKMQPDSLPNIDYLNAVHLEVVK